MTSLDRKLWRDLWHLRGQVIAVALVVACGIASFTTSRSAYTSLKISQQAYYERYRFAHVFASLTRAPDTLVPRLEAIPGVARIRTRVVVDVTLDVPGLTEPAIGRLVSLPVRHGPILNDVALQRGRGLDPQRRDEVLMSENFAKANGLTLGDTVGAVINGRWERLQIVGIALSPEYVYEIHGASAIFPDNKRFGVLWMNRQALASAFDMDGAFNDVVLTLMPGARASEVIFTLDQRLEPYGGLGAYGRYEQTSHRFLSDELSQLRANATIVPSIFLGVAAFLLHVVLSRLVHTQRDQIAVLKAFGYGASAIGWHYLKLALAVVSLGAALGTGVGLWLGAGLTRLYADFYSFPVLRYEPRISLFVAAFLISAGAAVVGALTSVRRAVVLPPAEAMRPEPPAHFRPTILERLGFQQLLSPAGRMLLRNLERKPVQAGLSVLGIALAVAILMIGRFFEDALQHIVDVQFRQVQREHVTMLFNEPRPARARHEVASLPGVLRAEPFRSIAVRLRLAHREKRVTILGLSPTGELRRLVDRDGHIVDLPPDGVILTAELARILSIQPGQTLTVEVLEGKRPVRQVRVAGLVDELIGTTAYMDIRALNRLLQEGHTTSGAYLLVDARRLSDLYTRLKRLPGVAGVSLRQAVLAGFDDTVAKNMRIFMNVLVVFACIITFSVVYNAARIALSERGRELASLRVMGFTRAEIAVILLGEQAIVTLVAIPCGFALGYWLCTLMPLAYDSELFRIPVVVSRETFAFACLTVIIAAVISGLIVRRRLDHLDLIAVLKTRE